MQLKRLWHIFKCIGVSESNIHHHSIVSSGCVILWLSLLLANSLDVPLLLCLRCTDIACFCTAFDSF